MLKEQATQLGLHPETRWNDVLAVKRERDRIEFAKQLGLGPSASWEQIRDNYADVRPSIRRTLSRSSENQEKK
jgi:hypothetical protein